MAYRLEIASCHSHWFTHSIVTTCDVKVSRESISVAAQYYLNSSFTFSEHHLCLSHSASPGSEQFFVLTRPAMCRTQNDSNQQTHKLNTSLAVCIDDCSLPDGLQMYWSHHIQFYSLSLWQEFSSQAQEEGQDSRTFWTICHYLYTSVEEFPFSRQSPDYHTM